MKTKRMTKAQLIHSLAQTANVKQSVIKEFLELLAETVRTELLVGNDVVLPDLCKFTVVEKSASAERTGVNPFTKKPMVITAKPATKKVRASVVKALKQAVK